MIHLFKKQNRDTILDFLQNVGNNPDICSERRSGIPSFIKDENIYVYATNDEIVILMTDAVGEKTELADEEYFNGQRPLYFTEHSHRDSPVWKLSVACRLVQGLFQFTGNEPCLVWGFLLTTSMIINYDDIVDCWNTMNVTVIDKMKCRAFPDFPVNSNQPNSSLLTLHMAYFDDDAVGKAEKELQQLLIDKKQTLGPPSNLFDDDDFENAMTGNTDSSPQTNSATPSFSFAELDAGQQRQEPPLKAQHLQPLSNPREQLKKLVGCTDVKRHIDELMILNRYNKLVRNLNPSAKVHVLSLHGIFFGRPGTGKTTVCKIYGSLLHEAGMLSRGHVIVCNRGTFVGSNWGDEERSVRQAVAAAQGGVLMIDEAYLLNSDNRNDPGKLVLPMLMDILADEAQRDIAVILCGYKEPMKHLIELNPGLESRFPNRFDFKDFSFDELLAISRLRVQEYGYHFTPSAMMKYKQLLADAYAVRDPQTWGNARFVANLLEHIYVRHARRCVAMKAPNRRHILCITPADIEPITVPQPKRRIGFGA